MRGMNSSVKYVKADQSRAMRWLYLNTVRMYTYTEILKNQLKEEINIENYNNNDSQFLLF